MARPGMESNGTLPGIAVATGVGASVTLGSESVGLYLKVAAGADLGVAFSPFFMAGNVYLDGILRLFIVSIEAHGQLTVEAPDPTYIKGEICGKVSFFFFSVKGCVGLEIGSNTRTLRAPDLVPNVWLQSHAPVLVAGQGGDRPIDASIGEAAAAGSTAEVPVVPIDTVPVVQFHASPLVANTTTFTEDLAVSPLQTPGGWVKVGGDRRVKYELTSLTLSPPLPGSERPDATWRRDPGTTSGGAKTNIDLALFSSVPVHGERALERSEMLDELVHLEWEGLCEAVAPAVCVLWTFCGQPLGPSGDGWVVEGTAAPRPTRHDALHARPDSTGRGGARHRSESRQPAWRRPGRCRVPPGHDRRAYRSVPTRRTREASGSRSATRSEAQLPSLDATGGPSQPDAHRLRQSAGVRLS